MLCMLCICICNIYYICIRHILCTIIYSIVCISKGGDKREACATVHRFAYIAVRSHMKM